MELCIDKEEYTEVTKKDLDSLGLFASALGHIGDGNFHTSILYRADNPAERAKVEKCVHDMVDRFVPKSKIVELIARTNQLVVLWKWKEHAR